MVLDERGDLLELLIGQLDLLEVALDAAGRDGLRWRVSDDEKQQALVLRTLGITLVPRWAPQAIRTWPASTPWALATSCTCFEPAMSTLFLP